MEENRKTATIGIAEGDKLEQNTSVGVHANQPTDNSQKTFALSRVFVAIVTRTNTMPLPDGNSFWVVQGSDGKPALEPVRQSLLAVPTNVVLSVSLGDCSGLLFYVKNTLMPDLSPYSGIQVNVVHTEAVYNAEKGTISTEMSLYPTQYIPMSAMTIQQSPDLPDLPMIDEDEASAEDSSTDELEAAVQAVADIAEDLAKDLVADAEGATEDVKKEKEEGTPTE